MRQTATGAGMPPWAKRHPPLFAPRACLTCAVKQAHHTTCEAWGAVGAPAEPRHRERRRSEAVHIAPHASPCEGAQVARGEELSANFHPEESILENWVTCWAGQGGCSHQPLVAKQNKKTCFRPKSLSASMPVSLSIHPSIHHLIITLPSIFPSLNPLIPLNCYPSIHLIIIPSFILYPSILHPLILLSSIHSSFHPLLVYPPSFCAQSFHPCLLRDFDWPWARDSHLDSGATVVFKET